MNYRRARLSLHKHAGLLSAFRHDSGKNLVMLGSTLGGLGLTWDAIRNLREAHRLRQANALKRIEELIPGYTRAYGREAALREASKLRKKYSNLATTYGIIGGSNLLASAVYWPLTLSEAAKRERVLRGLRRGLPIAAAGAGLGTYLIRNRIKRRSRRH